MIASVDRKWKWLQRVVCMLAVGVGVSAQAATVTFSDITSAMGEFGTATQTDDALSIDVSGFVVDTIGLQGGAGVSFDTIAFLVTADPGYYITSIKYTEGGSATTDASSFAGATATWVVSGTPLSLGSHLFGPSANGGFTLTNSRDVPNVTSLLVSITNNLFAFGPDATVSKNLAMVEVTTTPIPEPASLLFLLSGLGLVAWVRRRRPV